MNRLARAVSPLLLIACCVILFCNAAQAQTYDGRWWKSVSEDRQSGYLEGFGDCMTWTVRRPGFNGTSQQLREPITKFYVSHPADLSMPIADVWSHIEPKHTIKSQSDNEGEEDWRNAHWYLDGDWWGQSSRDENLGFVEGHLSCLRTYSETLPRGRADELLLHHAGEGHGTGYSQQNLKVFDVAGARLRNVLDTEEVVRISRIPGPDEDTSESVFVIVPSTTGESVLEETRTAIRNELTKVERRHFRWSAKRLRYIPTQFSAVKVR